MENVDKAIKSIPENKVIEARKSARIKCVSQFLVGLGSVLLAFFYPAGGIQKLFFYVGVFVFGLSPLPKYFGLIDLIKENTKYEKEPYKTAIEELNHRSFIFLAATVITMFVASFIF